MLLSTSVMRFVPKKFSCHQCHRWSLWDPWWYLGLSPPPRMPVVNEGLGWDSLLKMVHNPGADWNPGRGDNRTTQVILLVMFCWKLWKRSRFGSTLAGFCKGRELQKGGKWRWGTSFTFWMVDSIRPQNGWLISWKTLLKWMIWGYHYFWKHPYFPIEKVNL